MILLKRTTFFALMIGVSSLHLSAQTPISTTGGGNKDSVRSNNSLLSLLKQIDEPYLSFLECLREYQAAKEPTKRLQYAREALMSAAQAGQNELTKKLSTVFYRDFSNDPSLVLPLTLTLADFYLSNGNGEESYAHISRLPENYGGRDPYLLRLSHSFLLRNLPNQALSTLDSMVDGSLTTQKEFRNIQNTLRLIDHTPRRSPILSAMFSSVIPGSGQIYCGHVVDGINSAFFCSILGSASYMGWSYQSEHRHFISLPIISTVSFLFFYISNIWGAAESANRFNNYQQSIRYYDALQDYRVLYERFRTSE